MARFIYTFMSKHAYVMLATEIAMTRYAVLERHAAGKLGDELVFNTLEEMNVAIDEAEIEVERVQQIWQARAKVKVRRG